METFIVTETYTLGVPKTWGGGGNISSARWDCCPA